MSEASLGPETETLPDGRGDTALCWHLFRDRRTANNRANKPVTESPTESHAVADDQ